MIYGSIFLFTVRLLSTTSVLDVVALLFLLSTITSLALIAFKVIHISFQRKHLKYLILTALFEPILYFLFETVGLKGTTTMMAGILATLAPFLLILFDRLFSKNNQFNPKNFYAFTGQRCNHESPYWYHIVGIILILLGAIGVNFLGTGKRMTGVKK